MSATYTFGCAAVTGKADWLVQSSSKNNQAQEALALNNVGEPIVAHYYQKISEMTFEVIIPDDESSFPEIGDIFTYDGLKYYVSAVSISETNTDFRKYSLTCKRFTSASLPA
jgi:hypothetical protein